MPAARKLMANILWEKNGVLLVELMQQETTITPEVYCEILKRLRRAIQSKRRGMLTYSAVVLHGNARPHTAARTRALLKHFKWELFEHPPYDLAPDDYHLFTS
jgi:transposase